MFHWISLALAVTILPTFASSQDVVVQENLYYHYQNVIQSPNQLLRKSSNGFSSFEQGIFVDALWDLAEDGSFSALSFLDQEIPLHYDLTQKLRLGILRIKHKRATNLPAELSVEIINALQSPTAEIKIIYLIAAYQDELIASGETSLVEAAKTHKEYFDIAMDQDKKDDITKDEIEDLFNNTPDVTTYMNGEYVKSVKIFMFCRTNRLYPCLMVMKNVHGEAVRDEQGVLWSHKSLASSARGLPSYVRNGNTPQGIHTIDSVMPVADMPMAFGKFRRMILNFIPKSADEKLIKSLLPASSQDSDWWKPATVARDIGRDSLRIHGTGKINLDKNTPYYPFMRTSGCIAQRENTYDGVTYSDQRILLDSIMEAMDLQPTFESEPSIKGVLYVVEIDSTNAEVTLEDLALRGIE